MGRYKETSAGVYEPRTPCCACVTTHAVFVSWWPLAAVRFMSLIPGSAPSIHFAAALSSQANIKLLPIAPNAVSQGDVCIWHHVLSGDQPEMNNRCPWLHRCCSMSLRRLSIWCSLFNSLLLQTHPNGTWRSANTDSVRLRLIKRRTHDESWLVLVGRGKN